MRRSAAPIGRLFQAAESCYQLPAHAMPDSCPRRRRKLGEVSVLSLRAHSPAPFSARPSCSARYGGTRRGFLSEPADQGDQPISAGQRLGHRQPCRARPGLASPRSADGDRDQARRRRHCRLRRRRQGRPGRLHRRHQFDVDGHRNGAAPKPALRSGEGFRSGRHVRRAAERAGRLDPERVQDGRRSGRGGQGEARHADLCVRRHRFLVAYGRRAACGSPPRSTSATCRSAIRA